MIAPEISGELIACASRNARLFLAQREYAGTADLEDADLVIAATSSPDLNRKIAEDARRLHRLVNDVSDGTDGTFTSMALHRAGRLTIGVSAGGVPTEAARVRDEIARMFDSEYASALETLASARRNSKEARA